MSIYLFVWASEKRFGVLLTNEPGFGLVVQFNYLGADVVRQMLVQGVTEMEIYFKRKNSHGLSLSARNCCFQMLFGWLSLTKCRRALRC